MQPLLLLKQTLEVSYDPGALLLDGPNVRITSTEQFLSKTSGKTLFDNFTIKIDVNNIFSLSITFRKYKNKKLDISEVVYKSDKEWAILRPGMTHLEILSNISEDIKIFQTNISTSGEFKWTIERIRCFLISRLQPSGKKKEGAPFVTFDPTDRFDRHIRGLIHVPGLRGNPERTYKTTAFGPKFSGTFDNYVASVINHWQVTKDHRLSDLGKALETLGLTWKVDAKQIDDTQVELRVGRLPYRTKGRAIDMVSIADVGFGLSQTLPVLVALLTAEPGQLVYIEQPEIHLHPRAQTALAQILAQAVKRGVRVIVETHSALLLLAVQTLVAEAQLTPDKVKLHWFKRREDGVTEVTSADLDEAGAFGDWPEDFAEVALTTESRYLDAAELRQSIR